MTRGKSTNIFGIAALKPSTKQKLTILSRKRMTWLQRLLVATAGGKKQKRLAKITSPKDTVPVLTCTSSGRQASSSNDKANLLAEFFAQQCTDHGKSADVEQGAPYPLLESHTFPPIPEELVLRKLLRLKVNKSPGDSLLSNQFLKSCAPFLASSITYLFNFSLSACSFPCAWKLAKVIPLYKNRGSQSDPSNYRPISLLPAIGKVVDDIQSARLYTSL